MRQAGLRPGRAWLGLARAAGRLSVGQWQARRALAGGQARLVVLAADASEGTRRRFQTAARRAGCRWIVWATQRELGEAIGTSPKAVVAFLDDGLAAQFLGAVGGSEAPGRRPVGRGDGH